MIIWIGPWRRLPASDADLAKPLPGPSQLPAPPASTSGTRAGSGRTIEEEVRSIRASARRQIAAGQREQALTTLSAGLVLDARDTELNGLLDELMREAQRIVTQARGAASRRGATEDSSFGFREARAREREADLMERTGNRVQAVRLFWAAAGIYQRATLAAAPDVRASPLAASGPPPAESEKTNVPPARPERQLPPPPAQPQESLRTLPGTVEKPVAPPLPPKPESAGGR